MKIAEMLNPIAKYYAMERMLAISAGASVTFVETELPHRTVVTQFL